MKNYGVKYLEDNEYLVYKTNVDSAKAYVIEHMENSFGYYNESESEDYYYIDKITVED